MEKKYPPKRGEIWLVRYPIDESTSVQSGTRPALLMFNEKLYEYIDFVSSIPLTTKLKKLHMSTHLVLRANECGLKEDSMLLIEQKTSIHKRRLIKRLTPSIPKEIMRVVNKKCIDDSEICKPSAAEIKEMIKSVNDFLLEQNKIK